MILSTPSLLSTPLLPSPPWSLPSRRTRIAVASGLAIVFAAAIAFQAAAVGTSWGAAYWPFGCVASTAVCVLALVRNRWTATAALVIAAVAIPLAWALHLPAEPSPAMTLGLGVVTGSALRGLPPMSAAAFAGGGLAVAVAAEITARASSTSSSVANISVLGWLAAVAAAAALRLAAAKARAAEERVRREERLGLAREMHDVVAHHIASMLIQTQAAQVVARRRPEDMPDTLADIEAAGADALAAMRRAVGLLRDTADTAPFAPGPERLDDLVRRFARTGPAVRLDLPDGEPAGPSEVTGTVYRVVQESLTNVARHAPKARSVTVAVRRDDRAVIVEVADDAPRARPRGRTGAGGYGLVGMRERVEALGGTFDAGPGDGGGWAVRAVLPVLPARPVRRAGEDR